MIVLFRVVLDVLFAGIWQGATIAILTGALLFLSGRRLNAATRFLLVELALLAVALVPLLTTLPSVAPHRAATALLASVAPAAPAGSEDVAIPGSRRIDVNLSDGVVLSFVAAWAIGVAFFALRVVAGSLTIRRLVRRSRQLADRDGVAIYESSDIALPAAIGFRSRAVIVPSTLINEGSRELESALLHELAHIHRRDTWTNAWDQTVRALLFFNPAALLLLRAAALERETACDDLAVEQLRDLDEYVRNLAKLAIRALRTPGDLLFRCWICALDDGAHRTARRQSTQSRNQALALRHWRNIVYVCYRRLRSANSRADARFRGPSAGGADGRDGELFRLRRKDHHPCRARVS